MRLWAFGSSGQQAGGNEMKQSEEERKTSTAERGRHIWAELEK